MFEPWTALAPQGVDKLGWGHLAVNGLVGWAILVAKARQQDLPDPKPNTKPWQHLGDDLDALSEQLNAALS